MAVEWEPFFPCEAWNPEAEMECGHPDGAGHEGKHHYTVTYPVFWSDEDFPDGEVPDAQ